LEVVIIGMGAAGLAALESLRRTEAESMSEPAHVTVIAPEEGFPYSLCALPFSLCGEIAECDLERNDPDYLDLLEANRVVGKVGSIDPSTSTLGLEDGRRVDYDRLLVSTGSLPFVPPVPGLDIDGVHFLASLTDTQGIRDWVDSGQTRCVVIGAGFVGIEAAIALRKLGCEVTVVEMLEWVLPRVFDQDVAQVAKAHLEAGGIEFRLGAQVTRVLPCEEGSVDAVMVGEERIECDTVVVGIGVRPNIGFMEGTGVDTHHGILVGDDMQTSVPGIYAAGDVVEVRSRHTGSPTLGAIWPNAIAQGRTAGMAMAGKEVWYDGSEMLNVINLFQVPTVSLGLTSFLAEQEGRTFKTVEFRPPGGKVHKKLLIEDDRIIGVQLVGDISNAGVILNYIRNVWDSSPISERVLRGPLPHGLVRGGDPSQR
jgi:NAD(P)H-nitrite reductase large subunit